MSGLEIAIPVISAIFALVSAFKDGGTIVEKIKERRRRKGVQPPSERLQQAFIQGAQQIQQLRQEGVDKFGEAFERDVATAAGLKDVTIVLQDSIIRQLAAAHNDDHMHDFDPFLSIVIQARLEAVNILSGLHLALYRRSLATSHGTMAEPPILPRAQTITSEQEFLDQAGGLAISSTQESSPPAARARRMSWLARFRRPSSDMGQRIQRGPRLTPNPSPSDEVTMHHHHRAQELSLPLSPQSNPQSSAASPQPRRMSNAWSVLSPLPSPHEGTTVTEANKFAGICTGAWYAQQLQLAKAMEPSMRDYEWLYHCRKCKFRLHGDRSQRGHPHFDDRMQVSGTVYFRLLFLWKSHILVKDEIRRYQCLLCVRGGRQSNIYKGEDHLFEHIARHEGAVVDQTRITGPIEVGSDGVSAASIASFDFYIPQDSEPASSSFMLPDSAIAVEADVFGAPSLFSGDPYENGWASEGLHSTDSGRNTASS